MNTVQVKLRFAFLATSPAKKNTIKLTFFLKKKFLFGINSLPIILDVARKPSQSVIALQLSYFWLNSGRSYSQYRIAILRSAPILWFLGGCIKLKAL